MRAAGTTDPPPTVAGELTYQPTWDGFRARARISPHHVTPPSRHDKDLTRHLPDICPALAGHLSFPDLYGGSGPQDLVVAFRRTPGG